MQTDEPPFIKNKFAQLVVGVLPQTLALTLTPTPTLTLTLTLALVLTPAPSLTQLQPYP